MPFEYENQEQLYVDDFGGGFAHWHHEGIGEIGRSPSGGMRLHCRGSRQGGEGCMAFFRPSLPDPVACEYDLTVRSHGGLVINYLGLRGLNGEDPIADAAKLKPRTGIMANYWSEEWGLQSFHVSFSRFDDRGRHTATSNWRRNPGLLMVGHGLDPVQQIDRRYRIRLIKDGGHCQMFVDGQFAHGCMVRDTARWPIPADGKFGFRLIGSDVMADIDDFAVFRVAPQPALMSYQRYQP